MLKLLRPLKTDKSLPAKGNSDTNAAISAAIPQVAPSNPAGWDNYSSKLMGRLSSATQTPMPQMPGAAPTPETPRKSN